jgi:hypothetical protein
LRKLGSLMLIAALVFSVACGGDERQLPATPTDVGGSNSANVTAPAPVAPGDDARIDTIRPTLRVNNATSDGGGSRSYEFQVSDNSGFSSVSAQTALVAVSQSGVPEGTDGTTSYAVPIDLFKTTRYYWRARAMQGASIGPWSSTSRLRTPVGSYKGGNQAFDILTDGTNIADEFRDVSYELQGQQNPGLKLNGPESYAMYRIATLSEGEISFIARRVKPGDSSFNSQVKVISMQDGTGDWNANAFRVAIEKRPPRESGKLVLRFMSGVAESGGIGWHDHQPYYFKLEWRGGTARLRVFFGENEGAPLVADLSTSYSGTYSPPNHAVVLGSLVNDTFRDVRISWLYAGPGPRPQP